MVWRLRSYLISRYVIGVILKPNNYILGYNFICGEDLREKHDIICVKDFKLIDIQWRKILDKKFLFNQSKESKELKWLFSIFFVKYFVGFIKPFVENV